MKIGVLCAMAEELATLKAALQQSQTRDVHGMTFYEGQLGKADVVLVESGIGKVQAGLTTALLIAVFNAEVVINSGSAGGIGDGLRVGDVVLSTQTAYHDVDARAFDYAYGQLPGQPTRFDADPDWLAKLSDAATTTGLTVREGLIVTGDQFIASKAAVSAILDHFPDALSSEMEGAAVGQVAHQFGVPYVVVRAMSDVGDEDAGVSFDEFIVEAGKQSAAMLLSLFETL